MELQKVVLERIFEMNLVKYMVFFLAFRNFGVSFATIDSHSDLTGTRVDRLQENFFTKKQCARIDRNIDRSEF